VFADIDPVSFNLDPDAVAAAITDRTRAVIPVSLYGKCANLERINQVVARKGLPVIEDGCQSFGATRFGRRSCSLSTMGVTSFFPSKPLGCWGDGGMAFTDDEGLATMMRQIRVHGQDHRYHHRRIGVNARLDTLQAAVLLGKFPHFEEELRLRAKVAARYTAGLEGIAGLTTPVSDGGNSHVFAQYTIRVPDRDALAHALGGRGIPTAIHYPIPLHLQPAFAYLEKGEGAFPRAEKAAREVLSLPMHPFLTDGEVDEVCEAIGKATGA
jgi:UDP-2-acetamido-2-deoxy-ribo-hexuluronate aminotransferase